MKWSINIFGQFQTSRDEKFYAEFHVINKNIKK